MRIGYRKSQNRIRKGVSFYYIEVALAVRKELKKVKKIKIELSTRYRLLRREVRFGNK